MTSSDVKLRMTRLQCIGDAPGSASHVRAGIVPVSARPVESDALVGPRQRVIVHQAGVTSVGQAGLIRRGRIDVLRASVATSGIWAVVIPRIRVVIYCCHSSSLSLLTTPLVEQNWNRKPEHRFRGSPRLSSQSAATNWAAPLPPPPARRKGSSTVDLFRCSWSRAKSCRDHRLPQFSSGRSLFCGLRFATVSVQP